MSYKVSYLLSSIVSKLAVFQTICEENRVYSKMCLYISVLKETDGDTGVK